MERTLLSLLAAAIVVMPFQTHALESDWYFKPYIGADVGVQHLDFKENFGGSHFKENYAVTNFNLGVNLHDYVAIELGYESMHEREQTRYYPNGSASILGYTGFSTPGNGGQLTMNKVDGGGFNASLVLKYPICPKTEVMAFVGAAWNRLAYQTALVSDDGIVVPNVLVSWESDREAVGRFGVGIKQMLTDKLGGRLVYMYESNTSLDATVFPGSIAFNQNGRVGVAGNPPDEFTAKPDGSHMFMAGLFYQADWY